MAYAQSHYADTQGRNGRYRISQVGCFLTAFCNLLSRRGRSISPPELNQRFIELGAYIDAAPKDGILDDLDWDTIRELHSDIRVQPGAGTIPVGDVIVCIAAGNQFGTHFCLVDHIENGQVYILDSWDGLVKNSNVYGPITGWARYTVPEVLGAQQGGLHMTPKNLIDNFSRLALGRPSEPGMVASFGTKPPDVALDGFLNADEYKAYCEMVVRACLFSFMGYNGLGIGEKRPNAFAKDARVDAIVKSYMSTGYTPAELFKHLWLSQEAKDYRTNELTQVYSMAESSSPTATINLDSAIAYLQSLKTKGVQ